MSTRKTLRRCFVIALLGLITSYVGAGFSRPVSYVVSGFSRTVIAQGLEIGRAHV